VSWLTTELRSMLRDRVIKIVRSATTSKIDFQLRQWRINANSFEQVANGSLVLDVQVDSGNVYAGKQAQYDYKTDTLELPDANYGIDPMGMAGIVHESVHAYIDLLAGRITESANEAAGYLAQMLFLLHSGSTVPTPLSPGDVALRIARNIRNTPGARGRGDG
jgi:hypothetical protein